MTAYGSECFTMNEVNRLKILQDVIDGRLTTSLASQRLGLTDRHCRRLLARYRESGPLALANRRRGLRGNRQLVPGLAEFALGIIRDNYADFCSGAEGAEKSALSALSALSAVQHCPHK